jgi:hypothetical protein
LYRPHCRRALCGALLHSSQDCRPANIPSRT